MSGDDDPKSSERTLPLTPSTADAIVQSALARLAPGDTVAGRYRIVSVAGEGGMGVVYRAEDLELGGEVALKTLHTPTRSGERAMSRFRREVQLARRVTHPNVCRIFDFGYHDTPAGPRVAFVTMELLDGETLSHLIGVRGRLSTGEAGAIAKQMCAGLAAAHDAGVIHRDLKSANVIVVRRAQSGTVRTVITDFGLARLSENDSGEAALSHEGALIGTPAYMAPEQISGGEIGPATDIYALGVVLYEMLTGKLPFAGSNVTSLVRRIQEPPPSPRLIVPDIDPVWEGVILRCLERDPKQRFGNANDVARALSGEKAAMPPPLRKRHRGLAAILALAVLATLGVYLVRREPAPSTHVIAPAAVPRRQAVAVLGFRDLSATPQTAWLSTALAEMLTTELASSEKLRMIPGEEVARAKTDLSLRDVEAHAPASLTRLHKAIGADVVVVGSYTAVGKQDERHLRVDVRVQRTGDGETIAAFNETGTEAGLFDLVGRTGAELRKRLGLDEIEWRGRLAPRASAARLYAEGVSALRRYEALAAREQLEEAVAIDPRFPLAHSALSDAYAILGYDTLAADAARRAHELSEKLPRSEKLLIEAKYYQRARKHEDAIRRFRELIKLYPDDPEYRVHLINTLIENGRGKEAHEAIDAMRKAGGGDARIDLLEAWTLETTASYEKALAAADRAIAIARPNGSRNVLAEALVMRGWGLAYLSRQPEAVLAFDEAEDIFAAMGNRAGVAKSLRKRAFISWREGNFDETVRLLERARKIYEEIGQKLGLASAIGGLGIVKNDRGDYAGALEMFELALPIYREIGDRQNVAWALGAIAGAQLEMGEYQEGIANFERSLAMAKEIGNQSQQAYNLANMGIIELNLGNLASAERRAKEALAIITLSGDRSASREAEEIIANIAFHRGDLAGARKVHEQSLQERRDANEEGGVADSQLALALIALHSGKPADAVALASAASSQFEEQERVDARMNALDIVIRAHLALRQQERAESALTTLRSLAEKAQQPNASITADLAAAHVESAHPNAPADKLRSELKRIMAAAKQVHAYPLRYDAELLLAQLETRAGRTTAAREHLTRVRDEAAKRDFGLYVRAAESLLAARPAPL